MDDPDEMKDQADKAEAASDADKKKADDLRAAADKAEEAKDDQESANKEGSDS